MPVAPGLGSRGTETMVCTCRRERHASWWGPLDEITGARDRIGSSCPSMPSPTNRSWPGRTTLMLTFGVTIVSVTGHAMPQPSSSAARSVAPLSPQDAGALVGTWELTEFSRRAADGRITAPWGSQPVGQITYDADGHVTALLMHEERNEAGGRPSSQDVQAEFSAYFGTYAVDATRRIVTHHVRGSLSAERASGELRRNYELKDGALILTFTRPQDGATNTLVWKRISHHRR